MTDSSERFSRLLKDISDSGISADHETVTNLPVLVAPTTTGPNFNQIRLRLNPRACWRLEDARFGFDSSFLLPETRNEIKLLRQLVDDHTEKAGQKRKPSLTVFGHADPVNNDDYNKFLSGRRAVSIFALLTRRAEMWEDLFSNSGKFTKPAAGDRWGTRVIQTILAALDFPPGAIDGILGDKTRAAVQAFQRSPQGAGLAADGEPGPKTREKLFLAYMNFLCGKDSTGSPFTATSADFLSLSETADGKASVQGCGEFNPILLFSKADKDRLDRPENKQERDERNAPNRRVTILLFKPGTKVSPDKWPCPTVKEGVAGCKARFFSDAKTRLSNQALERDFGKTRDTFGCRFYQQLTEDSPCERKIELVPLRVRLIDVFHKPVAKAKYTLEVGTFRFENVTDDQGGFTHLIPVTAKAGILKIEAWTAALDIVKLGGADEPRGARLRFENLGLSAIDTGTDQDTVRSSDAAPVTSVSEAAEAIVDDSLQRAILRFQSMVNIEPDGTLNDETVKKLREIYGS